MQEYLYNWLKTGLGCLFDTTACGLTGTIVFTIINIISSQTVINMSSHVNCELINKQMNN